MLSDVHTQLKVDTKHLKQLDKDVELAQDKAQRQLKERTDKLEKDLTEFTNTKLLNQV